MEEPPSPRSPGGSPPPPAAAEASEDDEDNDDDGDDPPPPPAAGTAAAAAAAGVASTSRAMEEVNETTRDIVEQPARAAEDSSNAGSAMEADDADNGGIGDAEDANADGDGDVTRAAENSDNAQAAMEEVDETEQATRARVVESGSAEAAAEGHDAGLARIQPPSTPSGVVAVPVTPGAPVRGGEAAAVGAASESSTSGKPGTSKVRSFTLSPPRGGTRVPILAMPMCLFTIHNTCMARTLCLPPHFARHPHVPRLFCSCLGG